MVAVTRGLLEVLNREELEGVIAHEVAHLKNDDIKFVSLAAALSAALLMILQVFGRGMRFSGRGRRSSSGNARSFDCRSCIDHRHCPWTSDRKSDAKRCFKTAGVSGRCFWVYYYRLSPGAGLRIGKDRSIQSGLPGAASDRFYQSVRPRPLHQSALHKEGIEALCHTPAYRRAD